MEAMMDPQFGEWVDLVVKWGTYIPEVIMYIGWKILLPWIGLASFIAKLTPSESDNVWVDRFLNVVHTSALNPDVRKARYNVGIQKEENNK